MIHRVDARLREEARRFRLVFACPDCMAFDPGHPADPSDPRAPAAAAPSCAFGYPVQPHLDPELEERDEVIFCKAFEPG